MNELVTDAPTAFAAIGAQNSTEAYPDENNTMDMCTFIQPPLTDVRFWIVTVFGSSISLVSIVENSFFFVLFSTRKHHRTTYNMYMMFLAFFDIFVSGAYILLMSMNVLSDYLRSVELVRLWFAYMVPVLTCSHIAMTSSSFLILAATFERYCITVNSRYLGFVQQNRKALVCLAILLGVISKGSIWLEFKISFVEECAGHMTEYRLEFEEFVFGTPYNLVWRFWYRNFVTIFFPFFALLALNISTVRALTRQQTLSYCAQVAIQGKKKNRNARSATRTMVLVVFTYLISNIISVALTTWEHVDHQSLISEENISFYAIALDLVSLLTNMACAFRPNIYMFCQAALRQEVLATLKNFFRETMGREAASSKCKDQTERDNVSLLNHRPCSSIASTPTDRAPEKPSMFPAVNGHSPGAPWVPNSQGAQLSVNCFGSTVKRASSESNTHGSASPLLSTGQNESSANRTVDEDGGINAEWKTPVDRVYDDDQASTTSSVMRRELISKLLTGPNDETLL